MDPQTQFCPNAAGPARGPAGQGTSRVPGQPERRYRCTSCERTGRRGRPRLVRPDGCLLGQVVKQSAQRRVTGVVQRVKPGTLAAITAVLAATRRGTTITTSFIERLNATGRARLAPLVRGGRAIARTETRLTAGRWLVGCADTCCWDHDGLRQEAPAGTGRPCRLQCPSRWLGRQRWRGRHDHGSLGCYPLVDGSLARRSSNGSADRMTWLGGSAI